MVSSMNVASLRAGVMRTYFSVSRTPRLAGRGDSCWDGAIISICLRGLRDPVENILECNDGQVFFPQEGEKRIDGLKVFQILGMANGHNRLERMRVQAILGYDPVHHGGQLIE